MSKLSAPILENIMPSFQPYDIMSGSIKWQFYCPKNINLNEINSIKIIFRSVINNNIINKVENISFTAEYFPYLAISFNQLQLIDSFVNSSLQHNNFYKIQLCLINRENEEGYYSNAAVIKYYLPKKEEEKIVVTGLERNNNIVKFQYKSPYLQETLNNYYYYFIDQNNNTIYTSDIIYHNSNSDIIINNQLLFEEQFYIPSFIEMEKILRIRINIETTNKIIIATFLNTKDSYIPSDFCPKELETKLYEDLGVIEVVSKDIDGRDNNGKEKNFLLRSDSKTNFNHWIQLKEYDIEKDIYYIDNTIEAGVEYKYGIQSKGSERDKELSSIKETKKILAKYEHIILSDKDYTLLVKFNPDISSFKNTILEQKTDTIGGKTPYFFRNKNVSYKEFQIKGLLSYWMDEENSFQIFENDNFSETIDNIEFDIRTTNLTFKNIVKEKNFKLKVMEWLQNGNPKLFRSPTEGSYIIRLMNISLIPQKQLGRMLHDFSATAYEIADYNYENLVKNNLIRVEE